mgnify:CR=1 FL=1
MVRGSANDAAGGSSEFKNFLRPHIDERVHARVDNAANAFVERLDFISNNNIGNGDLIIFSAEIAIALRLLPFLFPAAQFRITRDALALDPRHDAQHPVRAQYLPRAGI